MSERTGRHRAQAHPSSPLRFRSNDTGMADTVGPGEDVRFTGLVTLERPGYSSPTVDVHGGGPQVRRRQLVDQLPPSPFEQPGYGRPGSFNQQNPLDVPSEYDQPSGLDLLRQPSGLRTPPHGRPMFPPTGGVPTGTVPAGTVPTAASPISYNRAAPSAPAPVFREQEPPPLVADGRSARSAAPPTSGFPTIAMAPVTSDRVRDAVLGVVSAVRGSSVLALAARYIGTPYRYGGTTPRGFDCAGFTRYVFGQLGVTLPRTANLQMKMVEPVPRSCARPGDLVFLLSGGRAQHVGIYAGGQTMFDAPRPGDTVQKRAIWSRSVVFGRVIG